MSKIPDFSTLNLTSTAATPASQEAIKQSVWRTMLSQQLWQDFIHNPGIVEAWPIIKRSVLAGKLSATTAVKQLFNAYHHEHQ